MDKQTILNLTNEELGKLIDQVGLTSDDKTSSLIKTLVQEDAKFKDRVVDIHQENKKILALKWENIRKLLDEQERRN